MGYIISDVQSYYLPKYPDQEKMLKSFLNGFDVTYAEKKEINNTTIFAFILKPEDYLKDAFGITREVILAYSPYDDVQPRFIQGVDMLIGTFPFKNRVDTLNCLIVSKDKSILDYAGINNFDNNHRSIIPFHYDELLENSGNQWYIRNVLRKNCYDVDLFGYTLPLRDESSFFGRQQIVARHIDSIKRCENRGIFGVRKTGKTSLLFKIDRLIREQKLGFVFFYDCKSPSYRNLHWNELLGTICDNIAKRLKIRIRKEYDTNNIIKSFRYVMKVASEKNKRIIIMFDEIEYISFNCTLNEHWKSEFIDFWQTIWSVQSIHRNLVFILSGVNPSVTEIDVINGIQNPLFGIVQSEYLQGLSIDESRTMIRMIGKRMGLKFDYESVDLLYNQYNGHPMLLRLACSFINRQFSCDSRPKNITKQIVEKMQNDIDVELAYYFKHVVSEIQQFYPDEYEMFELLASGQISDFIELSTVAEFTKHLYSYGLIDKDLFGNPFIKMPVAGRYVAMELARKENRNSLYKIVDSEKREGWIRQRIQSIIRDLRQLEMAIKTANANKLFGENSFPEAEKFAGISPICCQSEFDHFFNVCNRCFVESIENYGTSIGKTNYFWNEIKNSYPNLFKILHKIKVYRHSSDHLSLNPTVADKYKAFWNEDTDGFKDLEEQFFVVQQKLIEDFLTAIQIEIANIS